MKNNGDYYNYGVFNDCYNCVDGADTLKEARKLAREFHALDGFDVHVYRLDKYGYRTGKELKV